ncbi:MAG: hypothetical protein PHE55_02330 [Methylococcaceae bacterium]|nr:hypothetical protein [Methylococcaceae bacterium]
MSVRGAGGTPGGVGSFFIGFLMMCWGFYLLFQSIIVTQSFSLGTSLFHVSAFGGTASITGSMILIPLVFGIGMIFYNGRNLIGWALALGSVSALLVGVLAGLQFTLRSMSLFDLLTILVLSMGGLGLFLSSLRSQ